MALLANQLMDARILSSMNGRVELPQFLRVPSQGSVVHPQMNPGQEDNRKNRKYPCPLCGKRFRFNSILSLHMRTHTGEKPFKCPYCDHRAAQKGNLKIHLRTHKQGILGKGRGRIREENRLLHELEERAILRDRRQMRGGAGGQGGGLPLQTPQAHQAQLQPLPPTVPAHPLQTSLAASPGSAASPSHASTPPKVTGTGHREEPIQPAAGGCFRCSFCKGKFRKQQELERHIRILHKPYKCTLCEFAASQEEELIGHVETAHITADAGAAGPKAAAAGGGAAGGAGDKGGKPAGEFPCEVCGQTFSQAWFLKGHMRKHKDSFEHCCQICGRRFKEPWFLKNHMKVHLNKLAAKSKPAADERAAAPPGGRSSNVALQDPRNSLYSQYISSIHSRFLSAEQAAGQQEYNHLLATAGIEVKVREMLGRMMVSSGDSPSLLALNHLFPTMSSNRLEYLQAAMADRDALSSSGGVFPGWPVMAPRLAVEPQLFGAKEIQPPPLRSYLSERRRSVDERKACSLGEADASEAVSRATTPGSLTHHEQSEAVSETTGGPTHSAIALQDSRPQTVPPPKGDQAYRCTLPSDYTSTQPTSLGFHMDRFHFTHWQSGRDLSSPLLQPPAAVSSTSTSPGPSPNNTTTLRPGSRENWSPDAPPGLYQSRGGDDTLHANNATQPDPGSNQVANGGGGGSLKGQAGKCEYEPLDLSVRPESFIMSHVDRCPSVLVPVVVAPAGSLYGNGNSSLATTTTAGPRLRNYSDEPHGAKPAQQQQCDLLARGGGGGENCCKIQTHNKNQAGLSRCGGDPAADQNGTVGGFEDATAFDPEEEEDEEEVVSTNWMMMNNNNVVVEPIKPQVIPTDFQTSDDGDEALSPPRGKLPKWGSDDVTATAESPISSLEKVTPGLGHPLQHHRSLLSVLRSSGSLNDMLLTANGHQHTAAALNAAADGALMDKEATSGGKPFRCRYCPYSASQKGNLKTHVLCVHRRPFDNSLYPDRRLRRSHSSSSSSSSSPSSSAQKAPPPPHQLYSPPPLVEDTPPTTPGREAGPGTTTPLATSPCGT